VIPFVKTSGVNFPEWSAVFYERDTLQIMLASENLVAVVFGAVPDCLLRSAIAHLSVFVQIRAVRIGHPRPSKGIWQAVLHEASKRSASEPSILCVHAACLVAV
jgi:hypothetical protein